MNAIYQQLQWDEILTNLLLCLWVRTRNSCTHGYSQGHEINQTVAVRLIFMSWKVYCCHCYQPKDSDFTFHSVTNKDKISHRLHVVTAETALMSTEGPLFAVLSHFSNVTVSLCSEVKWSRLSSKAAFDCVGTEQSSASWQPGAWSSSGGQE